MNHFKKIILTQPNYAWLSKRAWKMPPYTLALLNACLKKHGYEVFLFDPNFHNMTETEVFNFFKDTGADIIGVSSISTEYLKIARLMNSIIKKALPHAILIQGGIIPSVIIDTAMKDPAVDYWIIGEGEVCFPRLLSELERSEPDLSSIKGLAYWKNGVSRINLPEEYRNDLDSIPFADYGNLDFIEYGNTVLKYSAGLLPRSFPFAVTITSRGCPYQCIFCAGSTIGGSKIRFRSAGNVLDEIDTLYHAGIREIIFLDDHFLGDRERAEKIMLGLTERKYNLTWKCVNLAIAFLDRKIMELMRLSGCYQMTLSIESGSQYVLNKIIKKPVTLTKVPEILKIARELGFEIIANFVIGFPKETWDQIRETVRFAERINVDLVNFHLATPLPNTELMEICLKEGYLPKDFDYERQAAAGYSKGLILTPEFVPLELEILRAFEWDRINFSDPKRRKVISKIERISEEELEQWRVSTRRKCGINVVS